MLTTSLSVSLTEIFSPGTRTAGLSNRLPLSTMLPGSGYMATSQWKIHPGGRPSPGSIEATSLPLCRLQTTQAYAKLSGGGGTAVLVTDDVVDLVREASRVFMDEAVFATVSGAPGQVGSEFLADITGHERGFGGPALLPFLECVLTP